MPWPMIRLSDFLIHFRCADVLEQCKCIIFHFTSHWLSPILCGFLTKFFFLFSSCTCNKCIKSDWVSSVNMVKLPKIYKRIQFSVTKLSIAVQLWFIYEYLLIKYITANALGEVEYIAWFARDLLDLRVCNERVVSGSTVCSATLNKCGQFAVMSYRFGGTSSNTIWLAYGVTQQRKATAIRILTKVPLKSWKFHKQLRSAAMVLVCISNNDNTPLNVCWNSETMEKCEARANVSAKMTICVLYICILFSA